MRKLAEICIQRPVFAAMLILAMMVVGAASYFRLGVDRLPSVDLPTVSVRTSLPGATPEQTETEVTKVVEEVVNTVDGIEELRSISGPGTSIVIATFRLDRDIDSAAQDVRDRVATVVRRLPDDAEAPVVSKFDNDSRPVLTLSLSGDKSVRELTEIADKLVKVTLERAKGVGEVRITGGLDRTINVHVDADRLAAYGIPITAVRDALVQQNSEVPGGNITGPDREQQLRTLGRVTDPKQFNDIVIAVINGAPIRIGDVAVVEDGHVEQRSVSRLNGRPAVSIDVRRQSGANTIEVIEDVKKQLEIVKQQLPIGMDLEIISDQSRYIYAALHEINVHLVLGATLACLVVLLFMRSLRAVLIAGVAIPASVVSTFAMMWALDFTLNSVTMLALVLMVGIVIDDAIVVLENIFRFVEEKKMHPMEAARHGAGEIALAVLATTLSLVVIFIPVSFMSSISGRFLYQFGITAAVAVMVSLLVSFTLTPMLSSRLLKPGKLAHAASRTGFYGLIDRTYTALLKFVLAWRIPVAIVALLVMASAIPLYKIVRQDYLPSDVDEGEFSIGVSAPEGTSFTAMDQAMRAIEADLMGLPEVRTILASAGGGWLGGTNSGNIYVRIAPHGERRFGFMRLLRATLDGNPMGAFHGNYTQRDVMQKVDRILDRYRDLRIDVRNLVAFNIGGGNMDIDLGFRGPELEALVEYTEHLWRKARSGEIPGLASPNTSLRLNKPEVRVTIDPDRAADLNVNPRDIGTALRLMVGGETEVSRFRDPLTNEDYDVQLRLMQSQRDSAGLLPQLLLPRRGTQPGATGASGLVELRNLATMAPATTPARIERLNRQRAASFRARVAPGYALADRLEALRTEVAKMDLPPEYSVTVSGRGRELERTFREFIWAFALSIVFMYMILASNYESLIHPLTILLSLPLSVPFALLSLLLAGESLNLYSALGILVLFGVVKKNAILQIDHMNQLRALGMDRYEAIIQGNRDRLRPILMTTFTLVAGMLPLALGTGPGAEERRAVAIVVIGGQSLSLLLTLLVTPVAYTLFDDIGVFITRRVLRRQPADEPVPAANAAPAPRALEPAGAE